jgi:hypothetical protein
MDVTISPALYSLARLSVINADVLRGFARTGAACGATISHPISFYAVAALRLVA